MKMHLFGKGAMSGQCHTPRCPVPVLENHAVVARTVVRCAYPGPKREAFARIAITNDGRGAVVDQAQAPRQGGAELLALTE